ncbi:MAG: BrnA antitoxin family protein [Nitrospira sp.]
MKRYQQNQKTLRPLTPAEARRLETAPLDYSDIPPLGDEFFTKATEAWPPTKQQLTIRLDTDVLTWLKASGRGYQTRINRILRAAMESRPPRGSRTRRKSHARTEHAA